MMKKIYRPCVVAVFLRSDGKLLVGKRSDNGAWQFPQGGQESFESSREALYREVKEEIGSDDFKILREIEENIRYDFPPSLKEPITREFVGQEQKWFLCSFHDKVRPSLLHATSHEFTDLKWVKPSFVLRQIVFWKEEAYKKALENLGLI